MAGLLDFNGLTDYASIAGHPKLHNYSEGVSVLAWVYPHDQPFSRTRYVVHQNGRIGFGLTSQRKPSAQISAGRWQGVTGKAPIAANVWTHLAFAYDGKSLRLYVNGALTTQTSVNTAMSTGGVGALNLGRCSYKDDNYWCGLLGTVEIYGSALTETQLKNRMKATRPAGPSSGYKLKATRVQQPLIANGAMESLSGAGFNLAGGWRSNIWGENTSSFSRKLRTFMAANPARKSR